MESKSQKTTMLILSLIISIGLHLSFFLSLGVYIYLIKPVKAVTKEQLDSPKPDEQRGTMDDFTQPSSLDQKVPLIPDSIEDLPDSVIEDLTSEELEELEKKIEEEKPNAIVQLPSSRFERVTAKQATDEPVPETELYGAANSIARSDTTPSEGSDDTPAVSGKDDPTSRDIVDSKFNDGEIENEGGESSSQQVGSETGIEEARELLHHLEAVKNSKTPEELAQELSENSPNDSTENSEAEKAQQDSAETLKVENQIAKIPEDKPKQKPLEDNSSENTEPKEKKETAASKRGKVDHSKDPFAKALGMSSETKKNRVAGSLSRQGVASKNVKATVLGKYQSSILSAVEKKWQGECRKYADRLVPGQLTMAFMVNHRGTVVEIFPVDQHVGSEIQKGVTLTAIRKANIPAMPSKLKSSQQGQPVEVVITFNF